MGLATWGVEGDQGARRLVPGWRKRPIRLVGEGAKRHRACFPAVSGVQGLCVWSSQKGNASPNLTSPIMILRWFEPLHPRLYRNIQNHHGHHPTGRHSMAPVGGIFPHSHGACNFVIFSGRRVCPTVTLSRLPVRLALPDKICHNHSASTQLGLGETDSSLPCQTLDCSPDGKGRARRTPDWLFGGHT